MVRQLGIKGVVPPAASRLKANTIRQRKAVIDVECFWSVSDSSM